MAKSQATQGTADTSWSKQHGASPKLHYTGYSRNHYRQTAKAGRQAGGGVTAEYLASLLVQVGDELILGPVHRPLLSPHCDEGDASLRVVGVHELTEGLAPLLVLKQ